VQGVTPIDFINLLAKTLIPGLLTGVITAMEGLSIEGVATDIPQAVTRSVIRSNMALLSVSVIVSVLSYV
jgi:ABC-type transporter Mla maintaining outer membrane lipid asymmetry permease subunit MlaE